MKFKPFLPKEAQLVGDKYFLKFKGDSKCLYSGTYLGVQKDGDIMPSLDFIELIADRFGEVVLNKKNAWLFSCNRIITDAVKDYSDEKILVVRNGYNEIMGIAKRVDNKFMPIWDIGHILRREIDSF